MLLLEAAAGRHWRWPLVGTAANYHVGTARNGHARDFWARIEGGDPGATAFLEEDTRVSMPECVVGQCLPQECTAELWKVRCGMDPGGRLVGSGRLMAAAEGWS